jgi:antitoxin (DNA-binding transcriptional repressor) of toxin-antitoxin stability system
MRFVSVRQMRESPTELWKNLRDDQEIILTSNGKPVAIMAGTDEQNVERLLKAIRRAKAAIALEEMQRASIKAGTTNITNQEIDKEIKAIRDERKR